MSDPTIQMTIRYHEETKHQLHRYARSLGYLDWDTQPNPFRFYEGARLLKLPFTEKDPEATHMDLYERMRNPVRSFSLQNLSLFLELSLTEGPLMREATAVSCQQDIAGDGSFSLGMIAKFRHVIEEASFLYRHLFWESGMIGQVLYLEAEAHGVRSTGIGCFFDDPVHQIMGFRDNTFQSLYHFTVGNPVEDARLQTWPPYAHLEEDMEGPSPVINRAPRLRVK